MVTIQSGGSIQYAVTANLATTPLDISNTASIIIPNPGMNVDPNLANNSATDNSNPDVDLSISKNSVGAPTYSAGDTIRYQITVINNSTFNVSGITVSDPKPDVISTWDWNCLTANPTCTPSSGLTSDFSDSIDLIVGESLQYEVTATVVGNPGDVIIPDLVNTATISPPNGLSDSNTTNDSSSYTHTSSAPSEINIGPPDGSVLSPFGGTVSTFFISPAIISSGGSTPDFVFYERDTGTGIALDRVRIDISADGSPGSWITVFNWGDGSDDSNSNMSLAIIGDGGDPSNPEPDDRAIPYAELYNNTGVTIDIDSLGLSGSYPWIQFYCPTTAEGNTDNVCDIDSIQPYYP